MTPYICPICEEETEKVIEDRMLEQSICPECKEHFDNEEALRESEEEASMEAMAEAELFREQDELIQGE
jgi:hypothetical protein